MEYYVLNKALGNPLVLLKHLKVRVMKQVHVMKGRLESDKPISMIEMRVMMEYLDKAWSKFLDQYDMLCQVSGRGRLWVGSLLL